MKIGISTACFYLKEETEDALSSIKGTGAETCSVLFKTFYEYRPEFAKKYAANLGGVEVCSVKTGAYNFEPQLFSHSRRVRGDGFYWLDQVMRSAQLLGAKKYILKAPLLNGRENLQYLSGISEFVAGYGVGLCIENNSLGLLNTPYNISEIKQICPGICFSLNLSEAARSAYPYQMYLRAMAGSLSQVVVGSADAELIKLLKEVGFDGEIIIETQKFSENSEIKTLINQVKSIV